MASSPSFSRAHTLHRYCKRFELGDRRTKLRNVNLRMACDFILHLCEVCDITSLVPAGSTSGSSDNVSPQARPNRIGVEAYPSRSSCSRVRAETRVR